MRAENQRGALSRSIAKIRPPRAVNGVALRPESQTRKYKKLKENHPEEKFTLPGNPAKSEISPPKRSQKHPAPLQATNRIASSQDCSKVDRKRAHDRSEPPSKTYITQERLQREQVCEGIGEMSPVRSTSCRGVGKTEVPASGRTVRPSGEFLCALKLPASFHASSLAMPG